ncbi:MAG TPA: YggS family pyridoxal phosphate-dependent enzyme [Saprospiraceae bacterium]|nr:YggS family pyridoxal phosphate-dependent enzyme [Saprospiraceae bacterium]
MFKEVKKELESKSVMLVAVTKTQPVKVIMQAYDAGYRDFGENRVQELLEKHESLPQDIRWHLIGSLQRNKVKHIAHFIYLIHSIDSLKLLKEVNKEAGKFQRIIDVLLQIKIAQEYTKNGMSEAEAIELISSADYLEMEHVRICGLMGMATLTDDKDQVRKEFQNLKTFFDLLKKQFFKAVTDFKYLSMGMSGDYDIAIEEGSNMVRIGSLIFGERS